MAAADRRNQVRHLRAGVRDRTVPRRPLDHHPRRVADIDPKAQAEREHEERIAAQEALELEQKAKRDARYAARKAQKKKGR